MAKLFQFTNNIDYNDIDNKPKINNVTVEGNKSLADYGIQPAGNYAHLNANGKVPLEEIDDSLLGNLQFQGLWDAKTNSPELPLNPTINGQYWIVSESGDRFGTDFNVGDWIVATNGVWRKVDNTDAVISVNGKIGKVVLTSEDIAHNDTTVSKAIDNEINRAKESELLITSSLNNEIARVEAKEEKIKNVLVDHIKDNNNPHNVTKEQIGLGEVDNTSDINKPISNAVQLALNLKADKTEVYTKEESDEKFLTEHQDISGKQDVIKDLDSIREGAKLGETALQSFTETDPTVPEYVKSITQEDITNWNNKSEFSGNYNDLTNKPYIPEETTESKVSEWGFTKNDGTITSVKMNGKVISSSGEVDLGTVITEHQDISGKADKATTLEGYGITNAYTKSEVNDLIPSLDGLATEEYVKNYHDTTKQDKLIAGKNITIENNVISATGGSEPSVTYTAGDGLTLSQENEFSVNDTIARTNKVNELLTAKQDTLTAGKDITIENNVISNTYDDTEILVNISDLQSDVQNLQTEIVKKANTTDVSNALSMKQDTLIFDSVPTLNSEHPVYSKGIKEAIDVKQDVIRGSKGEIVYHNGNNVFTQTLMNEGMVVTNEEELEKCKNNIPSFNEVFNKWTKFSHQNGNDNAIPSEISAWVYDSTNDTIRQPLNTNSYVGFVSPNTYSAYDITVRLYSTGGDNDTIGLVAAFATDSSGKQHTLSFLRSPGGTSGKWMCKVDYCTFAMNSTLYNQITLVDKSSTSNGDSANWNSTTIGTGSIVNIKRNGNIISGMCSQFNSNELDENTLITIDLDELSATYPVLNNFKGSSSWGYGSFSQPNSMYENLSVTDSNGYILDILNNNVLKYNSKTSAWEEIVNLTPIDAMGIGRLSYNKITNKLFYNNGSLIYEIAKDTSAIDIAQNLTNPSENTVPSTQAIVTESARIMSAVDTKQDTSTAVNYNNITNCITEIPQDIKLELNNNNTIVLKKGSIVYVPNGVGNFDKVTITQDVSDGADSNRETMLFFRPSKNELAAMPAEYCFSGSTAPTSFYGGVYAVWYDTTNNVIKLTGNGGASWATNYSFPVCLAHETTTTYSISQIFNGFGYIGSTIFALPGIKGLIPNDRNADYSLKNIELMVDKVLTEQLHDDSFVNFILNANEIVSWANVFVGEKFINGIVGAYFYRTDLNKIYQSDWTTGTVFTEVSSPYCIIGNGQIINGKYSWCQFKTAFHALDYNDKSTISGWSMPSSRYIDLTLGASGTTYTAPVNGWVTISKRTNANDQMVELLNKTCGNLSMRSIESVSGRLTLALLPVSKGNIFQCNYTAGGELSYFRFIYAEGEN